MRRGFIQKNPLSAGDYSSSYGGLHEVLWFANGKNGGFSFWQTVEKNIINPHQMRPLKKNTPSPFNCTGFQVHHPRMLAQERRCPWLGQSSIFYRPKVKHIGEVSFEGIMNIINGGEDVSWLFPEFPSVFQWLHISQILGGWCSGIIWPYGACIPWISSSKHLCYRRVDDDPTGLGDGVAKHGRYCTNS